MTTATRLDEWWRSPRLPAALASGGLHAIAILAILMSSGRFEGIDDAPVAATRLTLISSRKAAERDADARVVVPPGKPVEFESRPLTDEILAMPRLPPSVTQVQAQTPAELTGPAPEAPAATPAITAAVTAVIMPPAQRAAIEHQVARLAEALGASSQARVSWQQDGIEYTALLTLESAGDDMGLDKAVAQVSAQSHGRQLTTLIRLRRLAFSNYTQMVDRWDPGILASRT